MKLGVPDTPAAVDDLVDCLAARGFERGVTRTGGMGGFQAILRGPTQSGLVAEVEVLADRGQWSVGLKFDGMKTFVDPAVWMNYLYGEGIGDRDTLRQARIVAHYIDEAAAAYVQDEDMERVLRDIGREFMKNHCQLRRS